MSYCGEPLKRHHLDFIFSKNPAVKVLNTYGPTEGTLFCTWQELSVYDYTPYRGATASIGKAIPGWTLSLEPKSDSELLDIVIYGEYIGKGYLSSVDASGFMVKVIAGVEQGTFVTGDLAELTAGNLYFQGRKDRQVKRNGYRVELGEVDFWITDFLKVASATVLIKAGLVAFIETSETISEVELRNWLSGSWKLTRCQPNSLGCLLSRGMTI
ncbi:MAG: AMP-binding protein [Flavobacteriales bacterium]|nr:AMP-binding protein [Flavobacteriales bacterium]